VTAALAAAFGVLLVLPSLSPHYGFYSDELYYLACTKRLALGYVDQPPLFVFVLRLHRELFGDSLVALRLLPAAAGALTVFLTGWMARRMGGGLFAQVLATLAAMVSFNSLVMFSLFTVNCLEILLWTIAAWLLVELCRSREPRLWAALGVVLGLSFLNKHTVFILIAGLAGATLLSTLRRDLLSGWPWLGALAFALLAAPNVYWQVVNDWPSLEHYRRLAELNLPTGPLDVLLQQILAQNPLTLPIWAGGVFFFLRSSRGRRFRPLGWLFATVLALAIVGGQSRADRIGGVYPAVFAGGAVLLEATRRADGVRLRRVWNTYTLPALMLGMGLFAATVLLPILPPDVLMHHPLYSGEQGWRPDVGTNRIPYHLGNRTHWEAFVARVAEVHRDIAPEQRAGAIILADYFGHAGAIEYYGRDAGLPPVYSPMAGYFLWGPPEGSPETVISIGIQESFVRANFEGVRLAAIFRCTFCPPVVNELPIYVASSPKRPFAELWPEIRRLEDRRARMLRAQEAE
jgi:4-amino-4-deoxy-L-arabinose transferase-like glycosyltransferase